MPPWKSCIVMSWHASVITLQLKLHQRMTAQILFCKLLRKVLEIRHPRILLPVRVKGYRSGAAARSLCV